MGKRLDHDLITQLIGLYQDGWRVSDIAARLGCSETAVRKYLKRSIKSGYDPHRRLAAMTPRIVRMYQEGVAIAEIGRRLGYAPGNIRARLKEAGAWVKGRKPTAPPDDSKLISQIVSLHKAGATVADIGRQVGYSPKTVRVKLRAAGVRLKGDSPTPQDIKGIVTLYREGNAIAKIARLTGFSGDTVRSTLQGAGAWVKGRKPIDPPALIDRIAGLYQEGVAIEDIGRQVGYSPKTVRVKLRAAGVRLKGDSPTPNDLDCMKLMKAEGYSITQIAEATGFHRVTVGRYLSGRHSRRPGGNGSGGAGRVRKTLSPEDLQRIEDLYDQGATLKEIERMTGIDDSTVRSALIRAEIHTPQGRVSPKTIKRFIDLYDRGTELRLIVERTGFSKDTIYLHLKRAGVNIRARPVTPEESDLMVSLWNEGLNLTRISRQVWRSPSTIKKYLTLAGVWDPDRPWGVNDPRHPEYRGLFAGGSTKSVAFGGWESARQLIAKDD